MGKLLAEKLLRLAGWKKLGEAPRFDKCVVVAAPHTSNWDFPLMMAFKVAFGLEISWLGKHTLFRPPLGWVFRRLGGISVDRRAAHGVVEQIADVFAQSDRLVLALSPEGTRGRAEYWKSGFYQIALAAKVPIVLSALDWNGRVGGFGPVIWPSGDLEADMEQIRAFYAGRNGKHPQLFGPIRLRRERD